jgi:hypothetical protein
VLLKRTKPCLLSQSRRTHACSWILPMPTWMCVYDLFLVFSVVNPYLQQSEAFPDPTAVVPTRSPKERYIHGDGLFRCVKFCVAAVALTSHCNS